MRSQGDDLIPLIGARRRDQFSEALKARELRLTPADLAQIDAAVPKHAAAGDCYPPFVMAHLDSESAPESGGR